MGGLQNLPVKISILDFVTAVIKSLSGSNRNLEKDEEKNRGANQNIFFEFIKFFNYLHGLT